MGGRGKRLVIEQPSMKEAKLIGEIDPETGEMRPIGEELPAPSLEWLGEDKPYELQGRGDFGSGRSYALLEATGRDWRIITRPANEFDLLAEDPADRFGMETPTLSWAKDGKAVHIYVDGMSTQDFLEQMGLEIDLKNATTTSKRLSRLFRPQAATAWFNADDIDISYDLSQPKYKRMVNPSDPNDSMVDWGTGTGKELAQEVVEKVWDGAGVVSREMLLKMIDKLPEDMDARMRAKTIRELKHARRVEFTLMTEDGQLKGHAMVSENLSTDFVIPEDMKHQVKLSDPSQRYVAFEFPHGQNDMRLDIQSAVNLHPFFEPEQLMQWMREDYQVFENSVRSGDITAGMAKLDGNVTVEDLQQWALREFTASGGDINWSGSFVKSYLNSYIKQVDAFTDPDSKIKLPIPGGRYYVMPSMVGRRANMPVQVARGEVFIDESSGTAWVNDQDWIELQDGASYGDASVAMNERWGIGSILGGADHDDALWVNPFTDYDGQKKMLLWRSPNEAGERVILKPSEKSATLPWQTVDGAVSFPPADSRRLIERADRLQVNDKGLIDLNPNVNDMASMTNPTQASPLHEVMKQAALREETNAALLGSVCNYQMVEKAITGAAPKERPAPLEEVIDLKKTGADGSAVASWVWEKRKALLEKQTPIPRLLADRISTRSQQANVTDGSHWLDQVETEIKAHVSRVRDIRDEMVQDTRPPQKVMDYALDRPDLVKAGARLNQVYAQAIRKQRTEAQSENRDMTNDDYERARLVAYSELEKTIPEDRGRVLVGSIASVYMRDKPGNDGVAWLMGQRNENGLRDPGFAQMTIQEMRKIGVLSEIIEDPTGRGLIRYQVPNRDEIKPSRTIGINGIWRNVFEMMSQQNELPSYDEWDVSSRAGKSARKKLIRQAKDKVKRFMEKTDSLELVIGEEEWKGRPRKVVYSARTGKKFGTIDKGDEHQYQVGQTVKIGGSILSNDSNVRATIAD